MRKAIKFYKSYFEVASELNDKDRLAFYDALFNKQFKNIEPNLKGMAKFAYISQKHSIDAQVKGYYDITKDEEFNPNKPPMQGSIIPPNKQEKEEVKEEVKEINNNIPNLNSFLSYAIEQKPNVDSEAVKLKYESWINNNWKDGNDKKIINWKTKLLNTLPFIKEKQIKYDPTNPNQMIY
jgi:hypothetical protein